MKKLSLFNLTGPFLVVSLFFIATSQSSIIPDTGQTTSYTDTLGEEVDVVDKAEINKW